jgi:hypothetical protein
MISRQKAIDYWSCVPSQPGAALCRSGIPPCKVIEAETYPGPQCVTGDEIIDAYDRSCRRRSDNLQKRRSNILQIDGLSRMSPTPIGGRDGRRQITGGPFRDPRFLHRQGFIGVGDRTAV